MNIPFVDLKIQYNYLKDEIDNAIQNVINETAFIKGNYVKIFEKEFSEAYGVRHCISCANGTDAIYITLRMLDIGAGDEVITVANTWISTAETITQTGAKPIFVDIHPDYYTIDTSKIEEKITSKTKAIIPVHLYGQPVEMDSIMEICSKHNLHLIEDCAQAHFAEWKGKKVGTMGIAGTFSFFPGKNLGAYGDAGAIITNNDKLAEKVRMFANHGALNKHDHKLEGINSRLDGLQAAILSVKLPHILKWTKKRIDNAKIYDELLKNCDSIKLPEINSKGKHVFHLYVVRTEKRDQLQKYLSENGIATGIHYPTPLPFLKVYEYLKCKAEDFPVAYGYKDNIISLPMFPELTDEQIRYVVNHIKQLI
ncbi:MAG: erythromycin biosynthesis sensory transduction protein eryC1 [Candidatus Marinimicrobia bacterium]|nr:erythromycin biosynthesis sensory transduction protein eryC1 [Candidatus Neomarinimicrobiota bacterium]|tara:strand:+ start:60973 stop:62073 length:1101 start_codon:yes stop_codon:yes gene_type:complete